MRKPFLWIMLPLVVCACDGSTAPKRTNVKLVTISPGEDQTTGIGGTIVLTATVTDTLDHVVDAPMVSWKSSDPARAILVTSTGPTVTVSAKAPSSGVTITAASGGRQAQVKIIVMDANAPHVSAITPDPLVPGLTSATVTGTDFAPTVDGNTVTIDGIAVPVTAASATQLTLSVPESGFPCEPRHGARLRVTANGLASTVVASFDAGVVLNVPVGQSMIVSSAAQLDCAELAPNGAARYLVGVLNTSTASGTMTRLQLEGRSDTASTLLAARARLDVASPPASTRTAATPPRSTVRLREAALWRRAQAAHMRLLETDRALVQRLGGPRGAAARFRRVSAPLRAGARGGVSRAAISPALGDTLSFFIRDINVDLDCTRGDTVRARTVYIGSHTMLFEDVASPFAGTMDTFLQGIGTEFDQIIYPMLVTNFGDPLAYDNHLAGTGKVLMLFSPVLNRKFNNVAGFVSACDFFPYDTATTTPGGQPNPDIDLVSNEAAIFYAYVPDSTITKDQWQAFIRGVLAHESKHIASYAAKFANNADSLEDSWLEEATAQISSEIYQRTYSHSVWRQPASFLTSVGCEPPLTAANGCTGDHPQVMLHHFSFLYDYLSTIDDQSPIGETGETYYGGAWSFVRWAVDQYASNEADMLKAINQTTTQFGLVNLSARTGASFEDMVEPWSLASALAAYSGFAPSDPRLTFRSWDQRGIFAGMHDQLVTGSTSQPAFPRVYPLVPHTSSFGLIDDVLPLLAGGVSFYDLTATAAGRQTLSVRSSSGAPRSAGANIRLMIVRLQ
jgi:hypothetical protein